MTMKTIGYRALTAGGTLVTDFIFTKPVPGIPAESLEEVVLRKDAEAEVERIKGLLHLATVDNDAVRASFDETLDQLLLARNSAKAWEESAAMFCRGQDYYCTIVRSVGALLGPAAYTSDDGSVQDEVLAEKVIELAIARLGMPPPGKGRWARAWNALMGR
jgi:hypothetical protein